MQLVFLGDGARLNHMGFRSLKVIRMEYMVRETAIGDLLVRSGIIDAAGLALARETQEKNGTSLSSALTTLGLADEIGLVAAIAQSMRLEALGPELPVVPAEVAALLPSDFCRKRTVLPLSLQGKILRLALADPMDYSTIQDAEFRSGKRVLAVVASTAQIQTLIRNTYPEEVSANLDVLGMGGVQGEVETVGDSEIEVVDPAKLAKDTNMPPVVRLVNLILSGAAKNGASDIHMEPKETYLQVRLQSGWVAPRRAQGPPKAVGRHDFPDEDHFGNGYRGPQPLEV